MTPEERELLQKTYALSQENNEMLKKIKGSQKTSNLMRWGYWILIIVLSAASFWLIQHYINSLQNAVNMTDTGGNVSLPSPAPGNLNLNQIINEYKQATQ